jgi:chromate transporter
LEKKARLITLFFTMLKIGAFTFGGGYAMIPLIQDEFVTKKGWIDSDEMTDILALSQSIPGAISVNSSIIIGYRKRGILGSLAAIFGLALPSIIILTLITYLYESFRENIYIFSALRGIRASVVALLFSAFIRLFKPMQKSIYAISLFVLSFMASLLFDFNTVYIIIAGIIIGLVSTLFIKRGKKC